MRLWCAIQSGLKGQEIRGDNLQGSWVYTASLAGQETKGTVKAILVPLSVWLLQGSKFDSVPPFEIDANRHLRQAEREWLFLHPR